MNKRIVESPCINVCILADDNICTGCFRTLDEIVIWSYSGIEQQQQIVIEAGRRKERVDRD